MATSKQFSRYSIESSPLFAEVLETDLSTLKELQRLGDSAFIFRVCSPRPGKKPRSVQDPMPKLKAVHKRLNRLIQRVFYPSYIQAGLKGMSYKTNAEQHSPCAWVCTIDVKSFYPNCRRERIYQFFKKILSCAPDVAELLTDLNTVNGHLPTGGPFSLLLSYWANRDVFEEIFRRANEHGLKMTLYVDDLTFSGKQARPMFLNEHVKPVLMAAGLVGHKIKCYSPKKPKQITGVIRTTQGSKVPFDRARKIRDCYEQLVNAKSPADKPAILNQIVSRLYEAAQIDPAYQNQAVRMRDCRRNLKI
jgi:RNA-directed DNA polymerase